MTLILHNNQTIDTATVAVQQDGKNVKFYCSSGHHHKPFHFESARKASLIISLIATAIHNGDKILDLDI